MDLEKAPLVNHSLVQYPPIPSARTRHAIMPYIITDEHGNTRNVDVPITIKELPPRYTPHAQEQLSTERTLCYAFVIIVCLLTFAGSIGLLVTVLTQY